MTADWWPFRHPWMSVGLTVAVAACVIVLGQQTGSPGASQREVGHQAPTVVRRSVCVTSAGFCPVPVTRTGDPCTCPDALHGLVPGHVERVESAPVRQNSRDWPERDTANDLYDWSTLVAP